MGLMSLMFALILGISVGMFGFTSYAQSQAKVSVRSAKVRKEASTSSDALAGLAQNDEVTITGQLTGSDGNIWYQVFVDANSKGYIRSDLVQITDGSTPPTITADSNTTTTTSETTTTENAGSDTAPATNAGGADITATTPVSATTTASSVRVRANASTGSQIVASLQNGVALTVIGTTTGSDGKTWYQVNFNSNGSDITGFIRSDFVNLSGELVPVEDGSATSQEAGEGQSDSEQPGTTKDWETQYDEKWYLVDNLGQQRYEIQQFFDLQESAAKVQKLYEEEHHQNKSQKAVVIILVILLIAMAAVITLLVFKLKDMRDALDFAEVENSHKRRAADRPAGKSNARPVSRQGTLKQGQQNGAPGRPNSKTNAQAARQNPQGTPQGSHGTAQRPQSTAQRPQGQQAHPASARPQGVGGQNGARPAGTRQAGANTSGAAGRQPQGAARPQSAQGTQNVAPKQSTSAPKPQANPNRYANADDEFEFEFLNWDGEEEI